MTLPPTDRIYRIDVPEDERVLRTPPLPYAFGETERASTRALVHRMKLAMHAAQGIGLSANQIGVNSQVFVGQISDSNGKPKFYALFNPRLTWASEEQFDAEEGCLSIPGTYGIVRRPDKVVVEGEDRDGRPVRIKAWGLLGRMFQHEIDHLSGKVFTDRASRITQRGAR